MSAVIYLDFTGAPAAVWPNSPAVSGWGTPAQRDEVVARVAEKFAPFDCTVTTTDPGTYPAGSTIRIIIAGDSDGGWDNAGTPTGGTAQQGGWFPAANLSTSCFVFPSSLAENPAYVAEAAAHEAGHVLGLFHHVVWAQASNGAWYAAQPYDTGNADKAPIMGESYFAARGVWSDGPGQFSPLFNQDDVALLTAALGERPYAHGQTIATADTLTGTAGGVISDLGQTDVYRFTATAPTTIDLSPAAIGPMLHAKLQVEDSAGDLLATAANPATLGQSIDLSLQPGTYYAVVSSYGDYGDLGQYTISIPEPSTALIALAAGWGMLRRRRRHRAARPQLHTPPIPPASGQRTPQDRPR